MRTNIKAYELIEKGLSAKTVSKLTESQIQVLHSRLISEQPQPQVTTKTVKQITLPTGAQTNVGGMAVSNVGGKTTITQTNEELGEEDEVTLDPNKKTQTQDPEQEGPGSNDGFGPDKTEDPSLNDDGMYNFESIEEEKKSKKNPWAICTAQLGKEFGTKERHLWSAKEKNKYERCVKDVKQSLKEGKNPVSLFIENEIMKIVEKNLPPRITKGDLMKYLEEQGPATAPTKPKEKPGTKERPGPTKPKIRPGKNPHPGEKEAPRAGKPNVSPEEAKDKVIKSITSLLKHGK